MCPWDADSDQSALYMRTTEWVLLDTETSGLGQPIFCVEIAAQRMKGIDPDGPPFRALLNHDVNIEAQAEALHGYSRQFLRANGRRPIDVHRDFDAYAGKRPVVAYNLSFDWARVLEPEVRRLGINPSYGPGFCALTLARRCVHETASHKLEALRRHFLPTHSGPTHHALDDVEVTTKLFIEVIWPRLEQAGIESFTAVAEFSRKTTVKECLEQIRNPKSRVSVPLNRGLEGELVQMIEGMLADDQIVDAEVWALKHWLDAHEQHKSELAARARKMIDSAFADGALSAWELDDIQIQLRGLVKYHSSSSLPQAALEPSDGTTPKRRLSLTKKQLEEEVGASLLKLLEKIVSDGVLSDTEIEELSEWLLKNQSQDLPAIGHLLDVVKDIVADGKIADSERIDLFLGIEKVLPVTARRTAKAAREEAQAKMESEYPPPIGREELKAMAVFDERPISKRSGSWRTDPMTDAQASFVRSMGGTIHMGASKGEASDLIESLLGNKPITSRQQMVMRFWARDRNVGEGPREISEWMDEFYREDSDRKLAWDLFKNESEDNGLQGDPNRVPLGVGPDYLARIKSGGEAAIPKFRQSSITVTRVDDKPQPPPRKLAGYGVGMAIIAIGLVVWALFHGSFLEETSPSSQTNTAPTRTEVSSTPALPSAQSTSTAAGASRRVHQTFVSQLRISGIIAGPRTRVSIEGNLLSVGDIVDRSRGILVHSIKADTRTITFIDLEGEIYSRTLE